LLNQLHAQEDSPHQRINNHLDGSIGGKVDSIAEMARRIEAVTLEDVVAAAWQVKLDTVYLLRGQEEAIN
jgi:predicted Zn-dependent peptidase